MLSDLRPKNISTRNTTQTEWWPLLFCTLFTILLFHIPLPWMRLNDWWRPAKEKNSEYRHWRAAAAVAMHSIYFLIMAFWSSTQSVHPSIHSQSGQGGVKRRWREDGDRFPFTINWNLSRCVIYVAANNGQSRRQLSVPSMGSGQGQPQGFPMPALHPGQVSAREESAHKFPFLFN